jgi:hypothetical protein
LQSIRREVALAALGLAALVQLMRPEDVTPAKAGVQLAVALRDWIPGSAFPSVAFAGMTAIFRFIGPKQ